MNNIQNKNIFYFLFVIFIFISCTNKNSTIGFPGTKFEPHEIDFDSTAFKQIYAYKDSLRAFGGNSKLVLGSFEEINSRILIRFVNLPTDTTFTGNPEITMYISNKDHFNTDFDIYVAPIMDKVFLPNFATWEKYNETDDWANEGGDGDFENEVLTPYIVEKDTLGLELEKIKFEIDHSIVVQWMGSKMEENFGLIIYAKGANNSFLEFHSTYTNTRPQISLTYASDDTLLHIETRQANYSTYIHDKKDTDFDHNKLQVSNIPPRSIFTMLDLSFESHESIWKDNGVSNAEELKNINVTQAFIVFSVDKDKTMMTNTRFGLGVGIPLTYHDEIQQTFQINDLLLFPTTSDTLRAGKMRINVGAPLQQIISKNRENNGLVFINHQSNMDFSRINVFGTDETDESLHPRLILRYTILKE